MIRALIFTLLASSAAADTPLTFKQFQAYVQGNTYSHAFEGQDPFGVQSYGADGTQVWWDGESECDYGSYQAGENGQICTLNDIDDFNYCWTFYATPSGLRAVGEDGTRFDMPQTKPDNTCPIQRSPS